MPPSRPGSRRRVAARTRCRAALPTQTAGDAHADGDARRARMTTMSSRKTWAPRAVEKAQQDRADEREQTRPDSRQRLACPSATTNSMSASDVLDRSPRQTGHQHFTSNGAPSRGGLEHVCTCTSIGDGTVAVRSRRVVVRLNTLGHLPPGVTIDDGPRISRPGPVDRRWPAALSAREDLAEVARSGSLLITSRRTGDLGDVYNHALTTPRPCSAVPARTRR